MDQEVDSKINEIKSIFLKVFEKIQTENEISI